MDGGQPKDFLTGMCMYLAFLRQKQNKGGAGVSGAQLRNSKISILNNEPLPFQ